MDTQNRLKSPIVWGSVVAQLLAILVTLGVIDLATSEVMQTVISGGLQLLAIFGILNNPTNKQGF